MSEEKDPSDDGTYPDTPRGWAKRWSVELTAAKKATETWHADGREAVQRFRDEGREGDAKKERRWNLLYAGVSTAQALLYGQVPDKMGVDRRFADAADDAGRTAGVMLQRNLAVDGPNDPYALALGMCLQDRLLPGLGMARVCYECEYEEPTEGPDDGVYNAQRGDGAAGTAQPDPESETSGLQPTPEPLAAPVDVEGAPVGGLMPALAPTGGASARDLAAPPNSVGRKVPGTEKALVEYVHWQDFRWSAGARHWGEVTWVAFRVLMSRKQLVERFGEEIGKDVKLNARQHERTAEGKDQSTPWDRAEVWEIWDKDTGCVYWYTEGRQETLGKEEDPLGLAGFFPCPRPMVANATTDTYLPRPDYCLARDLYSQIDTLQTRLARLESALRLVGARDKEFAELDRMVRELDETELVGVERWAALQEKGGVAKAVEWLPLEMIASAIAALQSRQDRLKAQLDEVTGINDIIRGQGEAAATATHDRLSTRFSSARLTAVQEDFARFATDLAQLRAEVVAKKFESASVIANANMANAPDMSAIAAAVTLLKSPSLPYRVKVRSETLALADDGQLKAERMEVLQSITQFVSTVLPMAQQAPQLAPMFLGLLQWSLAPLRGAAEVEGLIDDGIAKLQQAQQQPQQAQPPPPDPKLVLAQFNAQAKKEQIALESEARQKEIASQAVADNRREVVQREQNVLETLQEALIQHMLKQGWTPPGGTGGAPPAVPAVPPLPPPPSVPLVPPLGG